MRRVILIILLLMLDLLQAQAWKYEWNGEKIKITAQKARVFTDWIPGIDGFYLLGKSDTTWRKAYIDSVFTDFVTGVVSKSESLWNHGAYRYGNAFVRSDTTDSLYGDLLFAGKTDIFRDSVVTQKFIANCSSALAREAANLYAKSGAVPLVVRADIVLAPKQGYIVKFVVVTNTGDSTVAYVDTAGVFSGLGVDVNYIDVSYLEVLDSIVIGNLKMFGDSLVLVNSRMTPDSISSDNGLFQNLSTDDNFYMPRVVSTPAGFLLGWLGLDTMGTTDTVWTYMQIDGVDKWVNLYPTTLPDTISIKYLFADTAQINGLKLGDVNFVFGTEAQNSSSEEVSSTTSNEYQSKLRMVTASVPGGEYRIGWQYNWRQSSDMYDFRGIVVVDNIDTLMFHNQEPQDVDSWHQLCGFGYKTFGVAGQHTIDIKFATEEGGTAYIRNARIELWRVR